MRKLQGRRCFFAAIMIAAGLGSSAVQAQESDPASRDRNDETVLDEVIVTATRHERFVSDVPASISVFTDEQMAKRSVHRVDDIARLTPGVSFVRGSGLGSSIAIRGIASGVGASTTGIYINDVPVQVRNIGFWAANAYPAIFDVQRVEVLRGPQGTLFGAGSQGGAIRFITPPPSLSSASGSARTELAFTEHGSPSFEAGVAAGGPLVEGKLGIRGSAYYRRDGGYVDRESYNPVRLVDRNSDWQDSKSARLALAWAPTDDLEITPAIYYQNLFKNDQSEFWEERSDLDTGEFRNASALSEPVRDKYWLPSLGISWSLGPLEVISTTSYFDRDVVYTRDYSALNLAIYNGSPYPPEELPYFASATTAIDQQKNFVQEIRLQSSVPDARLDWVFGVFYARNEQRSGQYIYSPDFDDMWELSRPGRNFEDVPRFVNGIGPDGYYYTHKVVANDDQIAGFGEVTWNLTDNLSVIAGLRAARMKYDFNAIYGGPSHGPVELTDSGSSSQTPVTPKIGFHFDLNEGSMFYATAAKGFRPGGAQARRASVCDADLAALGYSESPTSFESDTVWSYELGYKGALLNGHLRVDSSVFQVDWSNIQSAIGLVNCSNTIIVNLGEAESRGFDVHADLSVTDTLVLSSAIGYTDATYTETILGSELSDGLRAVIREEGDAIGGNARPWRVVLSARNDFDIFDGYEAFLSADYAYNSEAEPSSANNPNTASYDAAITPREAYRTLNMRLGVHLDSFDVSVFATNLLNSAPLMSRAHQGRSSLFEISTLRPRTIGATVSYRF